MAGENDDSVLDSSKLILLVPELSSTSPAGLGESDNCGKVVLHSIPPANREQSPGLVYHSII